MKKHRLVLIASETPPTVELDSEAHAAYVRFTSKKIVCTKPLMAGPCIITVDLDASDEPVGIELIGVDEFGVVPLLAKAGYELPPGMSERTRYIPANLQPA